MRCPYCGGPCRATTTVGPKPEQPDGWMCIERCGAGAVGDAEGVAFQHLLIADIARLGSQSMTRDCRDGAVITRGELFDRHAIAMLVIAELETRVKSIPLDY